MVEGWWLLFPDVGLAIELEDSVAISWDGRECMHCTSAPSRAYMYASDALLSLFFGMTGNLLAAGQRVAEMKEALQARALSDRGTARAFVEGDRVWGKYYPKGCVVGSVSWRRATGSVLEVGRDADSVVVEWPRESGRGKSVTHMTRGQANQMLVHAGALAPRRLQLLQPGGGALVGQGIRVYWPCKDCMYRGKVKEYHVGSESHRILYDDGDDYWEQLGSSLTPEYVLDS